MLYWRTVSAESRSFQSRCREPSGTLGVRLGSPDLPEVGGCAYLERAAWHFGGPARLAGPTAESLGTRREFDRNSTGIRRECVRNTTGIRREYADGRRSTRLRPLGRA